MSRNLFTKLAVESRRWYDRQMQKEITSLQHPLVKHLVKLRQERAYRKEKQTALICGTKLISEIGQPLKVLLVEQGAAIPRGVKADEIYSVPSAILKKVTALEAPEPYAAEVALPKPANLAHKRYLLALDGVSDPGNLGTLLRTALALGWEGVFLTENSCDPFNEKALRAAKGATFRLPLSMGTVSELKQLIKEGGFKAYVATVKGASLFEQHFDAPLLLILGNEAHGVSEELTSQYDSISIPMAGNMESLNVAVAGGILLAQMKREE